MLSFAKAAYAGIFFSFTMTACRKYAARPERSILACCSAWSPLVKMTRSWRSGYFGYGFRNAVEELYWPLQNGVGEFANGPPDPRSEMSRSAKWR